VFRFILRPLYVRRNSDQLPLNKKLGGPTASLDALTTAEKLTTIMTVLLQLSTKLLRSNCIGRLLATLMHSHFNKAGHKHCPKEKQSLKVKEGIPV
jgi:hypothetical protein